MRRWKRSNQPIIDVNTLIACLNKFGGVWVCCNCNCNREDDGRFENASWVMSWQLSYILGRMNTLRVFWPKEINEECEKVVKK